MRRLPHEACLSKAFFAADGRSVATKEAKENKEAVTWRRWPDRC